MGSSWTPVLAQRCIVVSAIGDRTTRTISDKLYEAPNVSGVVAPPPLIYGGALAAGLLAKTLFPINFLPRRLTRLLGLPLLDVGLLLFLSSLRSMRRAGTDKQPRCRRSVPLYAQPHLPELQVLLRQNHRPRQLASVRPAASLRPHRHTARGDRTRGALPGAYLRRGVPPVQGTLPEPKRKLRLERSWREDRRFA